jgi:dipeptidase
MAFRFSSAATFAAAVLSNLEQSLACTAVGVGKDASASGSPMIAHSEDSGPMTNDVRLVRVPRKQWPEGSQRHLYAWRAGYPRVVSNDLRTPDYEPAEGETLDEPLGSIPQVSETWAYWDTDYAVQNEWGVSIGESTCTAKTVGWPANLPYGYNRAGIEDLSKIALERCTTARCAVETMGNIAVEQGFYSADSGLPSAPGYSGSSECLMVGDATPGEVWIFNIMTGKNNASAIWAAERVPDDHIAAIGNSFTIRKMNLSDSSKWLYSPKVSALAEEMGWWSPSEESSPEVFDFFKAYGYTFAPDLPNAPMMNNVLTYYSGRRMWRIFSLLSPSEGSKLDPNKGNLPTSIDPYPNSVRAATRSVTAQMVMDVYRDHYEGTAYDLTQGMAAGPFGNPNRGPTTLGLMGLWERAISMYRTTWSFVLEAKPHGKSVTWFGWDAPHGTAYLPLMGAATESAPESYHSKEGHMSKFSTKVAFWAFSMLNQYQDLNFQLINADVRAKAHQVEKEGVQALSMWEEEAEKLQGGDAERLALMTKHSNAFVTAAVEDWWTFAFGMFSKYGRFTINHNESSTGGDELTRYPEWWLRSPEVGFTSWKAAGPFHGILLDESSTAALSLTSKLPVLEHPAYLNLLVAFLSGAMAVLGGLAAFRLCAQQKHSTVTDAYYVAV